jgi:hypothetical protein
MLRKIHGTIFFHIKLVDRANIKCQIDQCCPQLRFFIFMVRPYIIKFLTCISGLFWIFVLQLVLMEVFESIFVGSFAKSLVLNVTHWKPFTRSLTNILLQANVSQQVVQLAVAARLQRLRGTSVGDRHVGPHQLRPVPFLFRL